MHKEIMLDAERLESFIIPPSNLKIVSIPLDYLSHSYANFNLYINFKHLKILHFRWTRKIHRIVVKNTNQGHCHPETKECHPGKALGPGPLYS